MGKSQLLRLCYGAIFLSSAVLFVCAAQGDLWLDEIWSISFSRQARWAGDVFTMFHHDNNHPLNTLYLYFVGEQKVLFVYRLLSVLSGICSVGLVGWLARREWGHVAALCSMVLLGGGYPFVLYFSEARGYAPAALFGLACYAMLLPDPRRCGHVRTALFWVFSLLGVLSHSTFLLLLPAFALWHLSIEAEHHEKLATAIRRLLALHAVPFCLGLAWYLYFIRGMDVGGGPEYGIWSVVGELAVLLLGIQTGPGLTVVACSLLLLIVVLGAASVRQKGSTSGTFYLAVLLLFPVLLLVVARPTYFYFRYFFVCFPFFVLLLSHLLGRVYEALPGSWRWLVPVAVAGMMSVHVRRDARLLTARRGHYRAALTYICDAAAGRVARVGSDNDFRNRTLFDFYAPLVAGGDLLQYVDHAEWHSAPPEWVLLHRQELDYEPPPELKTSIGRYRFVKEYGYSGISGWRWLLYRRTDG